MKGWAAFLAGVAFAADAAAEPQRFAIIDNDWSIAGGVMGVMPIIAHPDIG